MTRVFLSALILACVLSGGSTALSAHEREDDRHGGTSPRTVSVDCTDGGSIQRALARFPEADQLVINVHGVCRERVEIRRRVLLRGSDPATDGITGPASLDGYGYLVSVFHVPGIGQTGNDAVMFEHLSITGSPVSGMGVVGTEVSLSDVVVSHNVREGVTAYGGSIIFLNSTTVSDNGTVGVFAVGGGHIQCTDCQLTNNLGSQARADSGAAALLVDTQVTGQTGVVAPGGEVTVRGGSVTTTALALSIGRGGRMFINDGTEVSGTVACDSQGLLDSRATPATTVGMTQVALSVGGNRITNGCVAIAGAGTTTFVGATTINAASHATVMGGGTLKVGALSCVNGGKASTQGGTLLVNNVPGVPAACAP